MARSLHALMVLLVLSLGCSLLPVRQNHIVRLSFIPDPLAAYSMDPVDSAAVFRREDLVVKVRHLSKQVLNAEYAEESAGRINLNPFTYGAQIDPDLGYVPDRFTVFEVEVNNIALPQVQFDPQKAVLVTDRGDRLFSWGSEKGDAAETFEEYYRARRRAGGNDQDWYRRRMAIVERALLRAAPLFKGQRQQGKVVFRALSENVKQLRLQLRDFITGFDANGLPAKREDLEFRFTVHIRAEPAL